MQPRREPLLWLQCLAIGAIPLELLLIRLLLAGADPGPVPPLERLLLWAVAALAPAVGLWRRPADWGSLLLVRVPDGTRTKEQQQLSGRQGGLGAQIALILLTVSLLPLIWWLDESAGLVQELSPLQNPSRLVSLLLSAPLLGLVVWQLQQLVQSILLLSAGDMDTEASESWDSQRLNRERSSFGLQLLQLQALEWPAVSPAPMPQTSAEPESTAAPRPDPRAATRPESAKASEPAPASVAGVEGSEPADELDGKDGSPETSIAPTASVAVEPEQQGEEQESPTLDAEVVEGDAVSGGEAEEHGEQPEPSGSEEGEPDQPPESTPGSL